MYPTVETSWKTRDLLNFCNNNSDIVDDVDVEDYFKSGVLYFVAEARCRDTKPTMWLSASVGLNWRARTKSNRAS
jgi:hypothetical protein